MSEYSSAAIVNIIVHVDDAVLVDSFVMQLHASLTVKLILIHLFKVKTGLWFIYYLQGVDLRQVTLK